ncbi:XRE family transcriptional regulator [uncultured Microbacterium sp.]|uniref:helix-turn-helix domain-containing protein n=1 Tax=uncultured Microbacterium sp. TaxID=191216 RepID=UPI00261DF153|nr:XRE family transcriptional regulator [uncultured Microbacterium sp.]
MADTAAAPEASTAPVGARLRELRKARGISARALATRLEISPSAVSQIERGVLQPSIARLIAITDALDVPLADVFGIGDDRAADDDAHHGFALQRAGHAVQIPLEGGVTFRRISPVPSPGVDYFITTYPPAATAHPEDGLFRHDGYEIGTVLAGELTIDFDDERVTLRAGDAISYPCSVPHLLHNTGTEDVVAQWLIVHPGR